MNYSMNYSLTYVELQTIGFVFAGLFLVLGAFDGIYFHLIKYKLHLHSESRLEHLIHSVRGILLAFLGFLIFSIPAHDFPIDAFRLTMALGIVAIDLVLEIIDIYVERASRANLGGVSSSEMVLHVFASSCRMSALVLLMIVARDVGFSPAVNFLGVATSFVAFCVGVGGLIPSSIYGLGQKQGVFTSSGGAVTEGL